MTLQTPHGLEGFLHLQSFQWVTTSKAKRVILDRMWQHSLHSRNKTCYFAGFYPERSGIPNNFDPSAFIQHLSFNRQFVVVGGDRQ